MGYRKPMDYNSVQYQIHISGVELNNPRNDGFTQWAIKQDLYKIKWLVDEILDRSSTFSGEKEWLLEQEQERVWRILKS